MGDGKKLKEILNQQGRSIRQVAKATHIKPTTLYSIIQRDSNIRYDFALRLADVLQIQTKDICSSSGDLGSIKIGKCNGCKNNPDECIHCMRAYSDCYSNDKEE